MFIMLYYAIIRY